MNIIKALLILALAYFVVACGGAEERKAAYMEKAQQSMDAGDLDKARIELKNVLQIDPKDAPAYFMLGNIFERKQEFRKAFANYSRAAEMDPENAEYQAKLGRFYLVLAGDIDTATEKMNLILARDPNDINGLLLKAGILLKQEKFDEAMEISKGIFERKPDNIESAVFLATLYTRDKQLEDAIAVLEKAVELNPNHQALLKTLANSLFGAQDYDKSEKIWKQILDTHPEVFQNHLTLALFYQKIGESAKAETVLRSAMTADEGDVQRKLVFIEFVQQTKGTQQAIAELEGIIKGHPGEGSLRLALAQLQIADQDIGSAANTYRQAVKDFSDDETGITSRVQLAKIYMQKEDTDAAVSIIDEAAEIAPNDSEVNMVKAKIAIVNKNIEQAIISLRTVVKDNPENIEAYFLLAAAHRANNELDQAEEVITRAHENNRDNIKALLPLAKYHVQAQNVAEAEKVVDDYLRLDANNYDALSIKSAILNGRKDYAEAHDLAERMVSQDPDKQNGYIQSAPYLLDNKEFDKAIDMLNTGYQKTSSPQILKLKSEVQIAAGKPDDAIKDLEQVGEKDESIHLLLAKAYAAKEDFESAKKTLRDSIMEDKARAQSYISLAGIHANRNDMAQGVAVLTDGVNANPDNIRLRMTLASFQERNGEIENAIQQYEAILASSPQNLLANNNMAALLSDHRTDEASLSRAKAIADKLKDVKQPVIQDTVGWVYYKTGNYTDAVAILEKVVEAQPNVQVFSFHLGMAYHKAGNNTEAKKYLEASLAVDGEFQGRDIAEETLKSL